MNNERPPQITPTHETEESQTWDMLLTGRQKLEADIRTTREQHAKAQEQISAERESNVRTLAGMDALEAESRIRLAGHDEALEKALEKIENVRKIVAECEEAFKGEEESINALMKNLSDLEEAFDALEQELQQSRQ